MNINITPAVKIACMGSLGYLVGKALQMSPKQVAFIWMIAETANQIFQNLNEHFQWGLPEFLGGSCIAVINMLYLAQTDLLQNISKSALFIFGAPFSSGLLSSLLEHLKIELVFTPV